MKKLTLILIMLLCTAAFAQDLPRIAVYVTGNVPDDEKSALGTRMLASLVKSGRYRGIERSGSFLAEIEKEQEKQRSGAVDDGQISELGRMFGVKYVCIAAITPAYGSFQVSARIVDVETAEVALIGEAASPLKTMDDLADVSDRVVKDMFGEQTVPAERQAVSTPEQTAPTPAPAQAVSIPQPTAPIPQQATPPAPQPPKPPKKSLLWAGIGLDVLSAGVIAYGLYENENVKSRDSDWEYSSAEKSVKNRNIAYAVGTAVLLGGITIHIFF